MSVTLRFFLGREAAWVTGDVLVVDGGRLGPQLAQTQEGKILDRRARICLSGAGTPHPRTHRAAFIERDKKATQYPMDEHLYQLNNRCVTKVLLKFIIRSAKSVPGFGCQPAVPVLTHERDLTH